jgi:hypothetical protein
VNIIQHQPNQFSPTRRDMLRVLLIGGTAAVGGACAPVRLVLRAYPREYDFDEGLAVRTLTEFVHTVTPGLPPGPHPAVQVLQDDFYPLSPYRGFLASDLELRADRRFGRSFRALKPADRRAVIGDGLRADAVSRRLYTGAIFLTQIAVFGGIHDDRAGSPLIGFPGGYQPPAPSTVSYPDVARFRCRALSADGNPG